MTYDAPRTPRPLSDLSDVRRRVVTARTLREQGVTGATAQHRCRPGGPWQRPLPGVYLLHPGAPTGEERLHAALLYATRRDPAPGAVMVTGLAALALRGFAAAPALSALTHVDLLVPDTRRLRSVGWVRVVRAQAVPAPEEAAGLPVAPAARAVADAVARLSDASLVRRLLAEAVGDGHCAAQALVRELGGARLLTRPDVADAVDVPPAGGRAPAEARLYAVVRDGGLPEPCWNVDLRLPGGPCLGPVDAFWPEQSVAVEIAPRSTGHTGDGSSDDSGDSGDGDGSSGKPCAEYARRRELLERLGVTVVHLTPHGLRDDPRRQAEVVRATLAAADRRDPGAYLLVLPR
ncbi:hypothetical protein V1J52_09185 [Streptomyces sp. TRM 70351]|uniref:hypothetical protein n=1 Tax=Streptomyces sp. TRM 70351 TaxID=3116552 RepID=UPI002E7ACFE9|nr:hypothetical protein [Streptomyces sp. TRM 70351]MEE1928366.1 hypothetical protein [Streptomyces sp. TRM 70351]